jgi:hypothetical protein
MEIAMKQILKLIIMLLLTTHGLVFASIDGYYSKLVPNCFIAPPPRDGWDCESLIEEGIEIKRRNKNSFYLSAEIRGGNGSFCSFEGLAHLEKGKLVSSSEGCIVTVEVKGNVANIFSDESESCRNYCGVRAMLQSKNLKKRKLLIRTNKLKSN